jgi:hypothetical protein
MERGLPAPEGSPVTAYVIETHAPVRQGRPSASHYVDPCITWWTALLFYVYSHTG